MSSKKSSFSFDKLNNGNYATWVMRMQMYLYKESCWETIELEGAIPENLSAKDKKAWVLIGLGIEDNQLVLINGIQSGRKAWNALKEYHIQST
jgi:hypothetical protein